LPDEFIIVAFSVLAGPHWPFSEPWSGPIHAVVIASVFLSMWIV
jgi:hypothetical protein